MAPEIRAPWEIDIQREAGRIAADALGRVGELIEPGISTLELDREAEKVVFGRNATCEFKGYRGYPANICTSVNEEVVHGIPCRGRKLVEGDVIGIDIGSRFRGYVGDTARTFRVGEVSPEKERLLSVTKECLERAVEAIGPGTKLWEVSAAVQEHAEEHGYGIVREYAGHGIGTLMHEDPQVPNYVDRSARHGGLRLRPGMVICVEPMLNAGTAEVEVLSDGWTVVTKDRKPSAHFEHMIVVTGTGREILTLRSA